MAETLTPIQTQVLAALRARVDSGDPAPSYRDLCAQFGWSSTGTVRDHLRALARKGLISLGGGRARQVRLVEKSPRLEWVPLRLSDAPASSEHDRHAPHLPLVPEWLGRGTHFAVALTEDQDDLHLRAGDIAVVRSGKATRVKRGLLVWRVENGVRVKEARPGIEPTPLPDSALLGVLVCTIRRFNSPTSTTARRRTELPADQLHGIEMNSRRPRIRIAPVPTTTFNQGDAPVGDQRDEGI